MAHPNFVVHTQDLPEVERILKNATCYPGYQYEIHPGTEAGTSIVKITGCFKCRVLLNFYFGDRVIRRF